jgi:hypothetical protein
MERDYELVDALAMTDLERIPWWNFFAIWRALA